jgi:hypothetical protein
LPRFANVVVFAIGGILIFPVYAMLPHLDQLVKNKPFFLGGDFINFDISEKYK